MSCRRLRFEHRQQHISHHRAQQSCSPVGAWARQWVVAAPCCWGAAGVIADSEDLELVARLATQVESPVGHQCEVVAPLGEGGREREGESGVRWGDREKERSFFESSQELTMLFRKVVFYSIIDLICSI